MILDEGCFLVGNFIFEILFISICMFCILNLVIWWCFLFENGFLVKFYWIIFELDKKNVDYIIFLFDNLFVLLFKGFILVCFD